MRYGYVVRFTFSSFLSKIGIKCRIPMAYILCSIEDGIAKIF